MSFAEREIKARRQRERGIATRGTVFRDGHAYDWWFDENDIYRENWFI